MARRGLKIGIGVLVVLGGLTVAADRVAVGFAEDRIAEAVRSRMDLARTPEVRVDGFPFLTQVVGRDLEEVSVTAEDVTSTASTDGGAADLTVDRLETTLRGVRLDADFSGGTAAEAEATLTLSYEDLSAAIGNGVTLSPAGDTDVEGGNVRVAGRYELFGQTLELAYIGRVEVAGDDTLRLELLQAEGGGALPSALEALVRQAAGAGERRVAQLPEGVALESLRTTPDAVVVHATGTDVPL
ncbi:LmeA family phospholipid-binding protein [Allostreptomyces psammosilenae]|uniref:DUF2993 domain-containing protein n=1 Tax=Allostreptomyces psammosilenae TaxID=1892865 RepID=A0A853A076_9ACTN|nr:DUF2993 domain-containing protein [Allostreptomyces psammosilenae]NYI07517.1 hypothetical protein [Allostreptomyces psammosilenae]